MPLALIHWIQGGGGGQPSHPIAGPPPGIWGGAPSPYPDQGLPGQQPDGIWGGAPPPMPSHPIVIPLPPDVPITPGDGHYPSQPIVLPPRPDQGLPPYPDQGLPPSQPYPDQGLPGSQPHPDQGLPPGQRPVDPGYGVVPQKALVGIYIPGNGLTWFVVERPPAKPPTAQPK